MDIDLEKSFSDFEDELVNNIMNRVKSGVEPSLIIDNQTKWKQQQYQLLNEWKKENEEKFTTKASKRRLNNKIRKELETIYGKGRDEQKEKIKKAIKKGFEVDGEKGLTSEFIGLNKRRLNAIVNEAQENLFNATVGGVRFAESEYKHIINNALINYNTGTCTYQEAIDKATNKLLTNGIQAVEYSNGARVNIKSYTSMVIRTSSKAAYLQGEASMRDDWEIGTVIVSRRGVACPKCLKFVGRVFWDDVYGHVDPKKNTGHYPLLSEAIADGLYHPNCKDSHTTYFAGLTTDYPPMTPVEEEEANKIYDFQQKQGYYKKQIKAWKLRNKFAGNESDKTKAATHLNNWINKYSAEKREVYNIIDTRSKRMQAEWDRVLKEAEEEEKRIKLLKESEENVFEQTYKRKFEKNGKEKTGFIDRGKMTAEQKERIIQSLYEQYSTINSQFHNSDDIYSFVLEEKEKLIRYDVKYKELEKYGPDIYDFTIGNFDNNYMLQLKYKTGELKKALKEDGKMTEVNKDEFDKCLEEVRKINGKGYPGDKGDAWEMYLAKENGLSWSKNNLPAYAGGDVGNIQAKSLLSKNAQVAALKRKGENDFTIYSDLYDKIAKIGKKELDDFKRYYKVPQSIIDEYK